MMKLIFALIVASLSAAVPAQVPAAEATQLSSEFSIKYRIISVDWDKYLGDCQIQAVSEGKLFYIYAKQALWAKNCSHLPDVNSTVWGSGIRRHHGNGDQVQLVYSTQGGRVSAASYFLSRTVPYQEK